MNGDARYIVLLGLSSPADAVLCESCVWDNRHVTYVADSILGWRKTADAPVEGANRHRSRRAILRATAAVIAPSGRRMVSTERTLVPGCRVQPLGVMRYVPVASQTFIEQHLPDGFNRACGHERTIAGVESRRRPAGHDGAKGVPPSHLKADVLRSGGRGIRSCGARGVVVGHVPREARSPRAGRRLVHTDIRCHLDVPLFWQCWTLDSPIVGRIGEAVRSAAADLRRHRR